MKVPPVVTQLQVLTPGDGKSVSCSGIRASRRYRLDLLIHFRPAARLGQDSGDARSGTESTSCFPGGGQGTVSLRAGWVRRGPGNHRGRPSWCLLARGTGEPPGKKLRAESGQGQGQRRGSQDTDSLSDVLAPGPWDSHLKPRGVRVGLSRKKRGGTLKSVLVPAASTLGLLGHPGLTGVCLRGSALGGRQQRGRH